MIIFKTELVDRVWKRVNVGREGLLSSIFLRE